MTSTRFSSWIPRLAFELIVVFIGVYAAFALTQLQAKRDAEARRHELQAALVREIEDLTRNTRRVATQLPPRLAAFDSAVRAGLRPPLQPWTEPVRVETHMWQATLQSGALDLFDVPTIYSLSRFYNQLNAGFEQINQLRTLSESMLIPNMERGSEEFYAAAGRSLRPRYQWYRSGMERLGSLAAGITALGDSITAELGAREAPGKVR